MKKRKRIILATIGAVLLLVVLIGTFLQCSSSCGVSAKDPDYSCGCSAKKAFLSIDVYGLPSWILFFIALEAREKRKR